MLPNGISPVEIKYFRTITKEEERIGQYSSKSKALGMAKENEFICMTTCYRSDVNSYPWPRLCWTVCLKHPKTW